MFYGHAGIRTLDLQLRRLMPYPGLATCPILFSIISLYPYMIIPKNTININMIHVED